MIDPDDRTKIGKPKRPAYTFGLNFGAEYKGFFASMNWTGVAGCDIEMQNTYRDPFFNKHANAAGNSSIFWMKVKSASSTRTHIQ